MNLGREPFPRTQGSRQIFFFHDGVSEFGLDLEFGLDYEDATAWHIGIANSINPPACNM